MVEDLQLSKSERLLIWRRRQGLGQEEASAQLGISHRRYGRWERGLETPEVDQPVDRLTVFERLFILRRREGISQQEVAESLGCTRAWVQMMETGESSSEQLQNYWKGRANAS